MMFLAILISLAGGFFVSVRTALVLNEDKARSIPVGSLSFGLITGITMSVGTRGIIACALAGIVGWAIYNVGWVIYNLVTKK